MHAKSNRLPRRALLAAHFRNRFSRNAVCGATGGHSASKDKVLQKSSCKEKEKTNQRLVGEISLFLSNRGCQTVMLIKGGVDVFLFSHLFKRVTHRKKCQDRPQELNGFFSLSHSLLAHFRALIGVKRLVCWKKERHLGDWLVTKG